ncbi:acetyltransferase [Chitinophaga sp. Hz27]|uniref:acetyltransferase n=1 Tax=Chitinophaga sp. Hz27 TaxID=3347169 RepID=UPI0035DF926E
MKRLAIIGSGDLGQQIAYHAATDGHYEIAGFFDDFKNAGEKVGEHVILGKSGDIATLFSQGDFDCLMIGIGYKHFEKRKECFNTWKGIIPFGKVLHTASYVDPSCTIGEGVFILPGVVLDQQVVIGDNVLINVGSCIAHDTVIGAHSFLSPRVAVAGFVEIGSCCNIGINSTIIDNLKIVDMVQTGGGTTVINNLTQAGLYVGTPARFVR